MEEKYGMGKAIEEILKKMQEEGYKIYDIYGGRE